MDPTPALLLARGAMERAASWAALVLVTALLLALLYGRGRAAPQRRAMAFQEHLRELGSRLRRLVFLFLYWTVLFTTFRFEPFRLGPLRLAAPVWDVFDNASARIYVALSRTALPEGVQVIVTRPTEAVAAQIAIGLLLAAVLTLPAAAYEAWAFFGPGLHPRERRLLARALPLGAALFLAGAAFAFAIVVPLLLRVLYAFATPLGATPFLSAGALVGTLATFALVFGVAFELPLVMALLARFRIVEPAQFLRYWRHATVTIFIVAAIVTDPTLVSQLIVAALLLVLYWGGVGLAYLARPAPEAAAALRTPARSG